MAWWVFQHVVTTAALAGIAAAVCRFGRPGPVARHAMWLVVLVKFVTPPVVAWPWAAPDPLGVAAIDRMATSPGAETTANPPPATDEPERTVDAHLLRTSVYVSDAPEGFASAGDVRAARVWPWFAGLWIAGSLVLSIIEVIRLRRLIRRVRASAPGSPALRARLERLSARIGLRPIDVRVVRGDVPPAVWSVGRPVLLWPEELPADASEACLDAVMLHELAHVKRRDHLVGWLELVAGIVWWWNPLYWFVRSSLREQAELACDAWVISVLPDGRRAYAEALLALSGAALPGARPMAVVGIHAGNRRVLERRLVMIMKGRVPLRLTRVGVLSLVLTGAMTLPMWAAMPQDQTPPPTPPQQAPPPGVPPAPTPPPVMPVRRMLPPAPQTPPSARAATPRPAAAAPVGAIPGGQTPRPGGVPSQQQRPVAAPSVAGQVGAVPSRAPTAPGRINLPDDGQKLVDGFEVDRDAIQKEADQKVEARRAAVVKALQNLQDQYTKAGKLDEAVAIRDYLRAGFPAGDEFRVKRLDGPEGGVVVARPARSGRGRGGR